MSTQNAVSASNAQFFKQSLSFTRSTLRNLGALLVAAGRGFAPTRRLRSLAALILLIGGFGVAAQAQYSLAPIWSQQSPASNPGPRYIHSMAYDAGHGKVVLFGGFAGGDYASDTWLWDGINWKQASPTNVPTARAAAAMVYDPVHGNVVMFGGFNAGSNRMNDTWLWDGTNWTNVTPATITATNNPSARSNAGIAFDAALGEVVLFGGTNGTGLADTWLWNGTAWTQWTNPVPTNNPSPRAEPGMAYDAATSQIVLFGGVFNGSTDTDDTWTWNGSAWTLQSPANFPTARDAYGMDYDPWLGEVVLFGGEAGSTYLNETWAYNGTNWTQISTPATPAARVIPGAMVYDYANQQMVMYGGLNSTQLNDTWEFGPPSGNFGNVNVCPAGATTPAPCSATMSFTINGTNLQNVSATQAVTQNTVGLDFSIANATCGNPGITGSCIVNVTFTPTAPGVRTGQVQLFASGQLGPAFTFPVYGVGQGPAVAIGPGPQGIVNTANYSLSSPRGVLADGAGNLFISDTVQQRVIEVAANGAITTVGTGLEFPQGMAEDGAGNLFIADNNLNEVIEVPAGCTTSSCQIVLGSNLRSQLGVAVDGSGNLFIGDFLDGEVVESPAGCTSAACQIVVYSHGDSSNPVGLTTDSTGNLFIADFGLKQVVEVPVGCTNASCQIQIGSGWSQPDDVAVDAAGDVFVADEGLKEVIEFPAGCTTAACESVVASGIDTVAVAVNPSGGIFLDDLVNDNVIEITRSQPPSVSFPQTAVGSTSGPLSFTFQNIGNQPLNAESPGLITVNGLNFVNVPGSGTPVDCSATSTLAPGAACNLSIEFVPHSTSSLSGTAVFSDNALNAIPANQTISLSGTGLPVSNVQLIVSMQGGGAGTVTSNVGGLACTQAAGGGTSGTCGISVPVGTVVTLTAQGTATSLFTSWGDSCNNAGQNSTCTLTLNSTNLVLATFANQTFGNVNVCPAGSTNPGTCSNSLPITVSPLISGTVGAIQVVTQGATGLDFSLASGGSCTGLLIPGTPCTVNVNFAPLAPGLRLGSVQVFTSTGTLMASTPIFGVGQGSAISFGPGAQTTTPVSTGGAGVAFDAAGNIYMAGGAGATKINPKGVQTVIPVTGTGSSGFYDVAVDGAGNIYLADENNDRVVEITPAGVQSTVPATGLGRTTGVVVDGAGNLYITDLDNNRVVKITPNGVQTTVPTTGLSHPYYPAVDAAGNLYVLDTGNSRVIKVTPAGVQTTVPFSGLIAGNGVAVDAAGDVYVSDQVANVILEMSPGGVQTTVPTSGLYIPAGIKVDAAGDVLISDNGLASLVVVNRSLIPAISFATTNVGNTSSDSPVSFTVQNVGNQPLTGSLALNLAGGSFVQTATSVCSTSFPLAPGGSCGEGFAFIPQSATYYSGTATFTDNSLIGSGSQIVNLVGIGATNGVAGTVAVPNVVGQTQAAAATPIASVGLATGSVSTTSSQTVPAGSIISENPVAGTQVAVGSVVNLLISTGLPQTPAPNPLSLNNNYFLTGDYVSAGVTLRGTGVGGMATGTINIPTYTQSATQGVPIGADIVDAFLYWESVENTPFASSTVGTFNGYSIVGQQIGNDIPNYTDGAVTGTLRAYRASVNIYLPVGANGVRTASGAYIVSLPDSGGSTYPLAEGASLVLVYRVLSPNFPLKSVVIYDGAGLPSAGATQVVQGFYDAVGGANGTGKNTNIFASAGSWNNNVSSVTLGQSNQYSAPLNPAAAYTAVILSTPVNNSDNDGILDAWKTGPTAAGDFHVGQPGYYDAKTSTWVGLPGAKHGQKDLFVQMDYMCGAVLASGACDPTQENLFPSPDANGNDPLAMVQQAFAQSGVVLHLQVGNAVPETTCTDATGQLCQFPGQPGVVGWKNSLEFSKLYPRNLASCLSGGDCTTRFPYGQKDSYHYVLMGHSLAIPAWNTRYGTLTSINVVNNVTTIVTADRGTGINKCPSRITIGGVLGNPGLNGVYNTTGCADTKTITVATPGVTNWSYPNNTLPEPVIGLTSGTISSISGYSDLGGADSAVTLGLWLTAPNQDMSKRANVLAGTIFHEIGHTLGLSHGGLYYDTPGSYVPTFEANCKPNYQSIMNYLFQLDGVGPNQSVAFSNQTLNTLNESTAGSVAQLTDSLGNAATFPTSAWYVPYTNGSTVSPATLHCDGTPLAGESGYRVDSSIAPITPAWSNGQDLNFIGTLQTQERGYNDLNALDLRQVGATGGEFASLASVLSFGSAVSPLNISAGGNVTLGSGGTIALGSGGTVTLGSGGNVTLGSGGTITLGSGGNVTLGSGGNVTLGSGGTITPGSSGTIALGSGGNVTLGSGGTITLGSGGTITLGSGGNVTLGSGGTIALGSGGTVTIPSTGGSYSVDGNGGTITLGSGGNVTLGSGGNVTLGSGGTIALGSGGTIALGSGGNVTLGSGGTITLGSGGTIALGSGGNVTLGSGGTIALGSGGTVTLGSGGNVTLGSGGTVTLGSGGNVALGSGGNVTLGSGGTATLGAGGTITLGSGGNVTLGSGGNVTLGSGGTIALGSGGNVTLGSGGNVTLGSGGTIALGSGGTITLGSGGTVTLSVGGTITLGSGGTQAILPNVPTVVSAGGTITLGSGGTIALGSGGNITLGSGGTITLGSGGTIALGSGGNITLGSGGTITLGSGGTITLGSGGNVTLGSGGVVTLGNGGAVNLGSGSSSISLGSVPASTTGSGGPVATELTYETANAVVRVPTAPTETKTATGFVRINWNAPAFGVVQTYTIYRSSNGATPIVIGSVSGVNGNPPATEFTDTNPDLTSKTVVYTITTTLVPDTTGGTQRSSQQSAPAVLKNDQTITLGPLPSSVIIPSPLTVTATAMSNGAPNGLQVVFSATGSCAIGSQSIASNVSSAVVSLSGAGSCTVIASQPGSTTFNAANSVSGTFMVLAQGSTTKSQTINFPTLPNAQYGGSFSLSAMSSSGLPVSFKASGPCTTSGMISGMGVCSITASAPASGGYSSASLTQSFNIYPAVLKVTAANLTSVYGQALPALTYSYSGFVNNDTATVVSGAPALSTTATATSNAGGYPIVVSTGTLATPNYSFLYVNGTLTVQPASQAALTLKTTSPLTYGQSETLSVTGGTTGGAVTYNLASGSCGISGAKLTANSGTGTCLVTATMAGNTNYSAVTTTPANQVVLAQVSQAITFTTNPPTTAAYNSTFTVAATGGASGNAVTFTSAGACTNTGATYTMTSSTGTCSVIANQAGNLNYSAATQVTKTVTASGPLLTLSTSSINFGTLYLGAISAQTITVTNSGTAAATINDPLLSIVKGGNSSEFIALSLCPQTLGAGKSCIVGIAFVAGPFYTPQTATLQIMSNAPGSPQPVALSAQVINPVASFNPSSLNFGTVKHATSSSMNVTLSNPGGTALSLTGMSITGANAAYFAQTSNCGSSLAAGASCTVAVKFTPAVAGTFSANLTVVDNAQAGGGTQSIPLSGKGN